MIKIPMMRSTKIVINSIDFVVCLFVVIVY